MVEMGMESMDEQGITCMGVGMGRPCIMFTGTAAIFSVFSHGRSIFSRFSQIALE